MTNDAPKRIGLIQDGVGNLALATVDEADVAIHYIRADHAQAEKEAAVAEALREAIDAVDKIYDHLNSSVARALIEAKAAILALIPDQRKVDG